MVVAKLARSGEAVDMTTVCPALLRADVQAQLWESWTAQEEFKSLAPAPFTQPVVAQLAARDFPNHAKNA